MELTCQEDEQDARGGAPRTLAPWHLEHRQTDDRYFGGVYLPAIRSFSTDSITSAGHAQFPVRSAYFFAAET